MLKSRNLKNIKKENKKRGKMLSHIKKLVEKFLSHDKKIQIISHYDSDGMTSAAIMASALQRLDKKFSIKIIKQLEKEFIEELTKNNKDAIFLFLDLGS